MIRLTQNQIILWYSSLHDFHMMCVQFNDGAIDKRSGTRKLARTIKTSEYENTRSGVKCCITEKKTTYQLNHVDIPGPRGAFSDKVTFDIDCLTDGPVVQCDVPVAKNYYCTYMIKIINNRCK